jgi:hypothetical protein
MAFKRYYEKEFAPMREQAERFMSACKLEMFTREKVLNLMTAFALECRATPATTEEK